MILTAEKAKPFLTHPEEDIRSLAAEYFSDSWSRDPEILSLVLEARERFGDETFLQNLTRARHFVVTEETLDRLLAELDEVESERAIDHLASLIANAPAELLRSRATLIAEHPKLGPEIRDEIARRLVYLDWSGQRLWDELRNLASRKDQEDSQDEEPEDLVIDVSDEILDALADRAVPDTETICRLLEDPETRSTWLEVYLVELAGKRRLVEAIPHLVARYFEEDEDILIEAATEALARIGDAAAIPLLLSKFPEASWTFKYSAAITLGDLKHPESEDATLDLLRSESDTHIRTVLCLSLCDLISDQAVETVRREIATGSQMAFREVAPVALAVGAMLGQQLPQVAVQWERERNRQREALKRIEAASGFGLFQDSTSEELDSDLDPEPELEPSAEVTKPIRNDETRVGRNDPCPCGSGKKFKKCCGASR